MLEDLVIEPMTEEFILWRCLHSGPLSCSTIDKISSTDTIPWDRYRRRNMALLKKLTKRYGTCAILARDGDHIVGQLRFYPKAIYDLEGAGYLCLQQDPIAGPEDNFADRDFPPPTEIKDKTLLVHCMMTGSSIQEKNPYQRRGIGSRMVRVLIEWARTNNWEGIEADAFEDIPIIYEITGCTGHRFWEKLGFHLADRHPHPELQDRSKYGEFILTLEEQAKVLGLPLERACDRLIMRLNLA